MMTDLVKTDRPDLAAMSLDELAAEANREHSYALEAASAAVNHAIKAGEALTQIRDALASRPDGQSFMTWLGSEFGASDATAFTYMRLYAYRDRIRNSGIDSQGIYQAKQFLRGLPMVIADESNRGKRYDEEVKEMARELWADGKGISLSEIARITGASRGVVTLWVDPAERQRKKERRRRYREKLIAQRQTAQRKRVETAIQNRADTVSRAYSMIRKLTQVVDQGKVEVQDREGKEALRRAEDFLHQADAAIVKALGLK